jgi:hypothetical protein
MNSLFDFREIEVFRDGGRGDENRDEDGRQMKLHENPPQ